MDWVVRLNGEQAQGTVTIPYDLFSGRRVSLEIERLVLPGSDEGEDDAAAIGADPADGPRTGYARALRRVCVQGASAHLGAVTARFSRTADGLLADSLRTEDETFAIEADAGWVVDTSEPTGQRTWVTSSNC
ncbi:MAG: hypothetical protein U5K76_11805 [Woeseiaceae bacterium]|nr:hypothetical protein [Woeseiaceae bacterium]